MAQDRIILWEEGKVPSPPMVLSCISHFVGGAFNVYQNRGRIFIDIPGTPENYMMDSTRFIEVYIGDHVDVITRSGDNLTRCIADGLAKRLASAFNGVLE